MVLLYVISGILFYVVMAVLTAVMCKKNDIGISHYHTMGDDTVGMRMATVFWPVGIFVVGGIVLYRLLLKIL